MCSMRRNFARYEHPYYKPDVGIAPSASTYTSSVADLRANKARGGCLTKILCAPGLAGILLAPLALTEGSREIGTLLAGPTPNAAVLEAEGANYAIQLRKSETEKLLLGLDKYKDDFIRLGVDPSEFKYHSPAEAEAAWFRTNENDPSHNETTEKFLSFKTLCYAMEGSEGLEANCLALEKYSDKLLNSPNPGTLDRDITTEKEMLELIKTTVKDRGPTEKLTVPGLLENIDQQKLREISARRRARIDDLPLNSYDPEEFAQGDRFLEMKAYAANFFQRFYDKLSRNSEQYLTGIASTKPE